MAISLEVIAVKKGTGKEPHDCIQGVGVTEGPRTIPYYLSVAQVIAFIEAGTHEFWTNKGGKRADVIVAKYLEHKYIKTVADGIHPNNLLKLPPWT